MHLLGFTFQYQLETLALLMGMSTPAAVSHCRIPPTVAVWRHLRTATVMHCAWSKATVAVMLVIFKIYDLVFQVRGLSNAIECI